MRQRPTQPRGQRIPISSGFEKFSSHVSHRHAFLGTSLQRHSESKLENIQIRNFSFEKIAQNGVGALFSFRQGKKTKDAQTSRPNDFQTIARSTVSALRDTTGDGTHRRRVRDHAKLPAAPTPATLPRAPHPFALTRHFRSSQPCDRSRGNRVRVAREFDTIPESRQAEGFADYVIARGPRWLSR